MGLGFSKDSKNILNYLGGNEKILNNVHELKNVENKLVEFLNSTGFISSGIQDFPNYIKQMSSDTDSSQKDFNASGNADAITGIKDYMSDGLNINNVRDFSDQQVLDTGYDILNSINKSTLHFMNEDKAMLNYNISELGNIHDNLSSSINTLKSSNNNNNIMNLLNKTTNMLEQQKNYMTIIKNSEELSSLYSKFETNLNNNNSSLNKNILNYMNNVVNTASNLHDFRGIRKLYDDNKIHLNSGSIRQMKSLSDNLNNNMSFDTISNYVTKLYESIDNNKMKIHGGGINKDALKNRLLLNKNWDSSDTVKNILSSKNYTGGNNISKSAVSTPLNYYDGGVTLQNTLRNKLSISNGARNGELIKNANILSEKLNGVSTDLLTIIPELKRLNVIQLNDLEKIFKKFLYFSSFKHKNMYLILLDFFIDMQSIFIKQDFILKINNLISLMEKGSVILTKLNSIGSKLSDVVNFINKASSEYNSKYGDTKDSYKNFNNGTDYTQSSRQHNPTLESPSNRTPLYIDAYDTKINLDYDEIPDLTIINTAISQTVFRLLYSIRLSIYFKQLSQSSNNHSKEYDELVGKSIGAEIDKIKQDYTAIMNKINEFEHGGHAADFKDDKSLELNYPITVVPIPVNLGKHDVKYEYVEIKKIFMYLPTTPPLKEDKCNIRDHRAWGRTDLAWVDDETLRDVQLQSEPISGENLHTMISNYKEFFTNYYESVIGLYMAAQAIDIYLMQFTEKIKKTPELIEKLDSLLSSSKIASMIHSNKSLDKLINVFDPNNYHVVTGTSKDHQSNIDAWSNVNDITTNYAFTTQRNNIDINSMAFHQYFDASTPNTNVPFTEEQTNYEAYVDRNVSNNAESLESDRFFRKSSILKCGAGACDELRPMIDLIWNRVPDNSLNRGGLHNRHWSTVPGKFDTLGHLIHTHSNVHDHTNFEVNENITHLNDELKFHCLGSAYFEKFIPDTPTGKNPSHKMKELKEFYKNNTTLMNILSLFFSMLGIDDNTNTILSPKTIQEYLTNFMCWGSYTLTNVPSTIDINIGNCIPLSNDNDNLSKITTKNINFNTDDKNIGIAIFSYFVSIDISNRSLLQHYDALFDYDVADVNNVYAGPVGSLILVPHVVAVGIPPPPNASSASNLNNNRAAVGNTRIPTFVIDRVTYFGKHINNITLNKLIKTMSLMKRNIPRGIEYRLNNKQPYNILEENMFIANDVTHNIKIRANTNNPLFVGINDNLSVFNRNYTAMNVFDTNVRVTLIHSNQLSDVVGSKYVNTLQYKSQNMYSNIIKSIIGKILTVIGLYDLNDFKNNKPWRTYIMDTTRLTLGGVDNVLNESVIKNDIIEYYVRIPLLLKFYKTIFYDISQNDDGLKYKVTGANNESVKILPDFDYPFDALIKHYFMFSNDSNGNDVIVNATFNKRLYYNINKLYNHFLKNDQGNLLTYISQQLVKEINQKYGLLFNSDLNMYKARVAKSFGMDNDYVTSLYDESNSAALLYDDANILMNTSETHANLPSQKYTKEKGAYKSDGVSQFTNFSAKSYYDNIYDFRKFIQSILTDSINDKHFSEKYNMYSSFFDIEEYMNDIKNELKNNNMTDDEKILFLSSATHSQKTSVNNTESNKKQLLFDFVITPLKQIDNLINYLAHLRAVFSNEIITTNSKHSINSSNSWDTSNEFKYTSSAVLPSDSPLLFNNSNNKSKVLGDQTTYALSALYGFIPDSGIANDIKEITKSYVPFNEMLVSHPLNYEYNYNYAFKPYDYITKSIIGDEPLFSHNRGNPNGNIEVNVSDNNSVNNIQFPIEYYQFPAALGVAQAAQARARAAVAQAQLTFDADDINQTAAQDAYTRYDNANVNVLSAAIYAAPFQRGPAGAAAVQNAGLTQAQADIIIDLYDATRALDNSTRILNAANAILVNADAAILRLQNPVDNTGLAMINEFKMNNVVYNKGPGAFFVSNILYIDSQYHNHLPVYNEDLINNNPSYGLLANMGSDVIITNTIGRIHDGAINQQTGRRATNGVLLGPNGAFNGNTVNAYPLNWNDIKTTNLRLIGCWCPEDLAPNRLGLHEYPHIKPGHLQSRAYNSTYSATEYLISKLFKNCDLFDINSTPNVQSTFNVSGNVIISFNKIDTLIKEQLLNVTKVLNEFKTYVLSEYIHPCEFYLRSINSQYSSLFVSGVKQQGNISQKTTIYDIQGRLNRFLSGSLTLQDIKTDAKNNIITQELKLEEELYLDPCETPQLGANDADNMRLKNYGDEAILLITLNKMGARLITKLINPLIFKNNGSNSYVYNPKRLAYLPHQKLTSPLNTIDDQYYGKLSMEFFSDIQGASPQQNVNMIRTTDILYSEPNPNHCNFYFTNIINSVNHIVGTFLKAGSNLRDKKIYGKIVNIFKNHDNLLSSTIDTRFDSIEHINYLGDYGRTGHGTFFDKSVPFILYNKTNDVIRNYIGADAATAGNMLSYITNYISTNNSYMPDLSKLSFHHISLSSIDGISCENYMSSYICHPPEITNPTNLTFDVDHYQPDGGTFSRFKDTHEGMYPSRNYKATPINSMRTSYYGYNNIPKNNRRFMWYDIIGKPGRYQPLANICNIYNPAPAVAGADGLTNDFPEFNGIWSDASIKKLNNARYYFSLVYSYGAIQQSNFIYDDISKYNFKSVVMETYQAKASRYSPYITDKTANTKNPPSDILEPAAKWLKAINDPLKFFSKLQPFGNNLPDGSYILGIVSESLHGQYAPHIITSVNNGPRSNNFRGIDVAANQLTVGQGDPVDLYNFQRDAAGVWGNIGANPNPGGDINDTMRDNANMYKFDENDAPTELQLVHIQYTKDHLRIGQAIATYNPIILNWETYQPLQYSADLINNRDYNNLEKIQIKNKDKIYTNMFYKLSYAKLLTDLLTIDSSTRLNRLQTRNNTLFSLSLASAYSTPRNEHYGSSLFEYRPTFLFEEHVNKKMYIAPYINLEQFVINTDEKLFNSANPYDTVLSLDMGGTGYWQPTGKHPVISIANTMLTQFTARNTYQPLGTVDVNYSINQIPFNVKSIYGVQNAVLQPKDADPSRFGKFKFNNPPTQSYPDAYVPLDEYLKGVSILNAPERGIKEMAKEIHDVIFNRSIAKINTCDKIYNMHYKSETRDTRLLTSSLTKAAFLALSTCDSRMGPYNILSAVEDISGKLPRIKAVTTAQKLVVGGADFTGNNSSQYGTLNSLSSNILSIALRNSDEPLAISFQDNNKSIENGSVLLKTYATVIKNMLINWNANMDSKRNLYENLTDVSPDTKENMSAAIPYLLHETEALMSQIKLLQYCVTNNTYLKDNKNILELNLKQAKAIANILFQGLDSMKNDFNMKYTFGEQYSGHLNAISTNPTQNTQNVSFSAELYNFLSNCNEAVIRPLGSHNIYYKLNNITQNAHSSFFKRLFAVRKLYDKQNNLTCDECPSISKSINKLNVLLDKYTRKMDKSLIENVMNSCKKIKFTPFEESNINQFVCLTNNIHTNVVYKAAPDITADNNTISASISGFSKFFNVQNVDLNNLKIDNDDDTEISQMFNSKHLTPLNSLLFIANNNDKINTVNSILGNDVFSNDDIGFYENYSDCFDCFVDMINAYGKTTYNDPQIMKARDYKNSIYDKYQDDHYQLMVFNILDLNILPIDINALTREIPLFYVFNYSASLDEFLSTSMDAYNTEKYHNDVISKKTIRYLDDLETYLTSISPSASDYYFLDMSKYKNIDVNKTLYHNKFSHMNPQSTAINDIWHRKKFNALTKNMKEEQIDGYNQVEYLTKFNTITNLISNIFTATSSHKINSVNNLMDASTPYKYDHSHYSSSLYYNGTDLNIMKIPVEFYKNVTYNSLNMSNTYATVLDVANPAINGFITAAGQIKKFDAHKSIMEYVNLQYNFTDNNIVSTTTYNAYVNTLVDLDMNSFLGVANTNGINEFRNTQRALIALGPIYNNMAANVASTCIYGSRYNIMGYYDNDLIYVYKPNLHGFLKPQGNANADYLSAEFNTGSMLHNIYLNSYVKHNTYNCMFDIKKHNNERGILYTNTTQKIHNLSYSSLTIHTGINAPSLPLSYEICCPGFETNLCKNWLKLNSNDIIEYEPNALSDTRTIDDIMLKKQASNKICPNPCFFNNILVTSATNEKYELFKEMPYTTFYNLSCILSSVDEQHIESITKLQKLENAHFMMSQLKKMTYDKNTEFMSAIIMRATTSWGISDPRSLAFLGDQETLYKKISYSANSATNRLTINAATNIPYSSNLVCTRHPITISEYNGTALNDNSKFTLKTKFLLNINNISSDWMECNKSPKLHTSYKWLRIKPKSLFNHVLPTSDVKGLSIYLQSIRDIRFARIPSFERCRIYTPPAGEVDSLIYPRSCPLGISLIKQNVTRGLLTRSGAAVTEGICASDLHAAKFKIGESELCRKVHVLSHIMYSDKAFGYVPLRQLMLLDLGFNFIRYKITQENLYTTNKIISGSLLYDSEYHNERVYEEAYGIKSIDSMSKKTSVVPRVKTIDNAKRPGFT